MKPRYYHQEVGINSRFDSLQAAVLIVKLSQLESWTARRQHHAQRYSQLLREAGLDQHLTLPQALPRVTHVWNQYTIRVAKANAMPCESTCRRRASDRRSITRSRCINRIAFRVWVTAPGSLPETERAARRCSACRCSRR